MNEQTKTKFVRRPGKPIIKIALLGVLVLSITALIAIHYGISKKDAQNQQLEQQVTELEQENQKLEDQIDKLGSVESVEDIAQNELGLVNPGTVIIQPES